MADELVKYMAEEVAMDGSLGKLQAVTTWCGAKRNRLPNLESNLGPSRGNELKQDLLPDMC
jgi:hypothetical protein